MGVRGRMPPPEEILHMTQLLTGPGTMQVLVTIMLCVFWAAVSPGGSSRVLLSLAGRFRAPPEPLSLLPGLQHSVWLSPSRTITCSLNLLLCGHLWWAPEKITLPLPPKLGSMASQYLISAVRAVSYCTSKHAVRLFIRKQKWTCCYTYILQFSIILL